MTRIWLLISTFLLLALSFTYFVFVNHERANIPYSKIDGVSNDRFTTITQKKSWTEYAIQYAKDAFVKNKFSGTFTAQANDLGIIAVPFETHNGSIDGAISFRLKQIGRQNWYFQNIYSTNQIKDNVPFSFSFPKIKNSKNISFYFEIELLPGKQENFLSLSKTNNYFLAKYIFSKSELINNPSRLAEFFITKLNTQLIYFRNKDIATIFLISLLPFMLYLRRKRAWIKQLNTIKQDNTVFPSFLKTFSVIAVTVIVVGIFSYPLIGFRKWIPYFGLLIPSVILSLNLLKINIFNKRYFSMVAGAIFLIVSIFGAFNYWNMSWFGISGLFITYCYLLLIPLNKYKYFFFISAGTFIFLFKINSIVFLNNYDGNSYIWTPLIVLLVIWVFLFSLFDKDQISWSKINRAGFTILLIISSVLALRSDSLFLGSSEYHWSYFIGVIQTIHGGGELLWSAPSQYGLLNILLPSLLPWSSRNSFFIFQAALFVISTFIIIKTIYTGFKHRAGFILISLSALSLFYFGLPTLIGPSPFPSQSTVRFFCVYVLIYVIFREFHRNNILRDGIKWMVTGAYVVGALWSAESLFYCTAIYFTYLAGSTISILKAKTGSPLKFLSTNILIVLTAFIAFNISYLMITHHLADWSMYFMYAFGYAGGFGEFGIRPGGIFWTVIIALSCIVFILSRLYSAKKYGEWIVLSVCFTSLWILTSYYVGRATASNLTAILPEIFYIFIIMLLVLKESKFFTYRLLLNAVFLPWVVVGIMGGIANPQFIQKLQEFRFAENVNNKGIKPDNELSNILKLLKVEKGTRIEYYWDLNTNPIISDGKGGYSDPLTGMPTPLVLLEDPISEEKRDVIMDRFLTKLNKPVYLIYGENDNQGVFANWKKFFKQNYFISKTDIGNGAYKVFLIR
jgi:hypothetical protein